MVDVSEPEGTQTLERVSGEATEELTALREELKLKLHLAGMDARTLWDETLLPQLDRIEARLDEVARWAMDAVDGEEARLKLHLALMEARDRWERIEPTLRELGLELRDRGQQAADKLSIDRAKLQAHLARMDARDAIEERRDRVDRYLKESRGSAAEMARSALDGLRKAIAALRARTT